MRLLRDTWLQFSRAMWLTFHNPVWVFVGLTQPILYLVLFAPLLRSLAGPGMSADRAFDLFVPGLLIQLGLFARRSWASGSSTRCARASSSGCA